MHCGVLSMRECVTVNVITVVKVLDVEGGANGHQLLKPRPRDEQTAGEIEMHQQRESSTLRQTPATNTEPFKHLYFVHCLDVRFHLKSQDFRLA